MESRSVLAPITMSTPAVDFSLFGGAETLPPSYPSQTSASSASDSSSDNENDLEDIEERKAGRAGDPWLPNKVQQDPVDFLWTMTEEPHRTRRKAILKAHPEVSLTKFELPGQSPASEREPIKRNTDQRDYQ